MRKLVKDGFVIRKPQKVHSRFRANAYAEAKRKVSANPLFTLRWWCLVAPLLEVDDAATRQSWSCGFGTGGSGYQPSAGVGAVRICRCGRWELCWRVAAYRRDISSRQSYVVRSPRSAGTSHGSRQAEGSEGGAYAGQGAVPS